MPMGEAALAGIAAHGHRWRFVIGLSSLTRAMGEMDENTPDSEVEAVAKSIVEKVKAWLAVQGMRPRADELMINRIEQTVEELEFLADCGIEEVREAMGSLYDDFDYYRIVVV